MIDANITRQKSSDKKDGETINKFQGNHLVNFMLVVFFLKTESVMKEALTTEIDTTRMELDS